MYQKFYFKFAVFLSKFMKTYILLNFIHYYENLLAEIICFTIIPD